MYDHKEFIQNLKMSSRPQTPVAIRQKPDIIDLTMSPALVNFNEENDVFQAKDHDYLCYNGELSKSNDRDIIQVEEDLNELIIVRLNSD